MGWPLLLATVFNWITHPMVRVVSGFATGGPGIVFGLIHLFTNFPVHKALQWLVVIVTALLVASQPYWLWVEYNEQVSQKLTFCRKHHACEHDTSEELRYEPWHVTPCKDYKALCERTPFDLAIQNWLQRLWSNVAVFGNTLYDKMGLACVLATFCIGLMRMCTPFVKKGKEKLHEKRMEVHHSNLNKEAFSF